ncbi:MAG: glycosyltransferase [Crocosphaera sp.]
MKISIITVCRNAEQTIETAIKSVVNQTYSNIEYIIVDGESTDNTKTIISQYTSHLDQVISEPDTGIYNAMNKGIKLATGDFVYFLNSDDYLLDNKVIEDVVNYLKEHRNCDVIYGDLEVRSKQQTFVVKPPKPEEILDWMIYGSMPHQATLAKLSIFDKYGLFNENYKIVSDVQWYLNLLQYNHINWSYYPRTIASYWLDGSSNQQIRLTRQEFWEVHNSATVYQSNEWDKKRLLKYQDIILNFEEQVSSSNQTIEQLKNDLETTSNQLENIIEQLQNSQTLANTYQSKIQQLEQEINAMKTSKFWKFRSVWFKLKKTLNLPTIE